MEAAPGSAAPTERRYRTTGSAWFDRGFDGLHDVLRGFRRIADEYDGRMPVTEAVVNGSERLSRYLRADEVHPTFNFDYLRASWETADIRRVIDATLSAFAPMGAPATWVLSSHDDSRHVMRYGRARPGAPVGHGGGHPASPGCGAADSGAAWGRVPLPGRGARSAGRQGHSGGAAAGSDLGAFGSHHPWSRRLPGDVAMVREWAKPGVHHRDRQTVAPAARTLERAQRRSPMGTARIDVPAAPCSARRSSATAFRWTPASGSPGWCRDDRACGRGPA